MNRVNSRNGSADSTINIGICIIIIIIIIITAIHTRGVAAGVIFSQTASSLVYFKLLILCYVSVL